METQTPGTEVGRALSLDQRVFDLFDQYVHGLIDRRAFLDRAAKLAATGATAGLTATALLDVLSPRFAQAQQIAPNDKRLRAESITYDSPAGSGKVRGYLAHPAGGKGKLPGVLVIHENRGLNPHIEDLTRRLALAGFLAFAPDALTVLGGYPGDEDKARELFAKLDQAKAREDFVAALGFLAGRSDCNGHVGTVGFCYGGGMVNTLATRVATLEAAVAFYGMAPDLAAVQRIKAPLQLHYAEHDDRINASAPAYEAALQANHVKYEAHRYPGTQHGFNNDTTPRFDKAAAAGVAPHSGLLPEAPLRCGRRHPAAVIIGGGGLSTRGLPPQRPGHRVAGNARAQPRPAACRRPRDIFGVLSSQPHIRDLVASERLRPLRRSEYERMADEGFFQDERIELLDGVIVEMTPQGTRHAGTIQRLTERLATALGSRAGLRVQLPFAASETSEPEPDVAVVAPGDYDLSHPTQALLLIEVAESSVNDDRRVKAGIYAAAAVPEYWLIDLTAGVIEVRTQPGGDAYAHARSARPGDRIRLQAFPDVELAVSDILR